MQGSDSMLISLKEMLKVLFQLAKPKPDPLDLDVLWRKLFKKGRVG